MKHSNEKESLMSRQQEHQGPALHTEIIALKARLEALEARVVELEKELREIHEAALVE